MTKNVDFNEINKNLSLDDIDGEYWMDVVGYEGLYMVSCFGRVKSLSRPKKSKNGELTSSVIERIMRAHSDKEGYRIIQLTDRHGVQKLKKAHRLVCQAFIPNPENKSEVNHIDGVKNNNLVHNLEWTTRMENNHHAIKIGLSGSVGETNYNAKLSEDDVIRIMEMVRSGAKDCNIAPMFGVQAPAIYKIRTGRKWSHLTGIPFRP